MSRKSMRFHDPRIWSGYLLAALICNPRRVMHGASHAETGDAPCITKGRSEVRSTPPHGHWKKNLPPTTDG